MGTYLLWAICWLTAGLLLVRTRRGRSLLFRLGYRLYVSRLGYFGYRHLLLGKARKQRGLRPHHETEVYNYPGLRILPLAILSDNYSYLVIDMETHHAAVVDPADPDVVIEAVVREKVTLDCILTTHKHWDHSGGNKALLAHYPGLQCYGSTVDNVFGLTHALQDCDSVQVRFRSILEELGMVGSLLFQAVLTPGHTPGHMVYCLEHPQSSSSSIVTSLFTGDVLFLAGTGRLFEGNAHEMVHSLEKLSRLPGACFVWPGHEYTWSNLNFAASVEPDNINVKALPIFFAQSKLAWARTQLRQHKGCIPSNMTEELGFNPFLRCHLSPVISSAGELDRVYEDHHINVFAKIRQMKDMFTSPPLHPPHEQSD